MAINTDEEMPPTGMLEVPCTCEVCVCSDRRHYDLQHREARLRFLGRNAYTVVRLDG